MGGPTFPNFVDHRQIVRYVESVGATSARVSEFGNDVISASSGTYEEIFERGRATVNVCMRRFVAHANTPVRWHANVGPWGETLRSMFCVHAFVTPDESVLGRCVTAQRPWRLEGGSVHVTIADSRVTTWRAIDLVNAIFDACDGAAVELNPARRTAVWRAINDAVYAWPSGDDNGGGGGGGGDAAEAWSRSPAWSWSPMRLFVEARAPQPITQLDCGAVEIAGGTTVVAACSADFARRCLLESRVGKRYTISTAMSSLAASRERARARARARTRDHTVAGRDASSAEPNRSADEDGRGCGFRVVMVCQQGGCEELVLTFASGRAAMLVGVPMAQVAALAHSIMDEIFDASTAICSPMVLTAPTYAKIAKDDRKRSTRDEAAATIVRFVEADDALRALKARLWRPGGRLVRSMMADDVAS